MGDLLLNMPLEYEPLRKNRFLLRFPSDLGIQEWWVSNASRPTITMGETEIPFLNTSTWVVGRYIWEHCVTQSDLVHHKQLWNGYVCHQKVLLDVKVMRLLIRETWYLRCSIRQDVLLVSG